MKGQIEKEKRRPKRSRLRDRFKPGGEQRTQWIKQAKARHDAQKLKKRAIRPPPRRKPSRQKLNSQSKSNSEDSLADKLSKSIAERNMEMVKDILHELNRRYIDGGVIDEKSMQAARKFIRDADSSVS